MPPRINAIKHQAVPSSKTANKQQAVPSSIDAIKHQAEAPSKSTKHKAQAPRRGTKKRHQASTAFFSLNIVNKQTNAREKAWSFPPSKWVVVGASEPSAPKPSSLHPPPLYTVIRNLSKMGSFFGDDSRALPSQTTLCPTGGHLCTSLTADPGKAACRGSIIHVKWHSIASYWFE